MRIKSSINSQLSLIQQNRWNVQEPLLLFGLLSLMLFFLYYPALNGQFLFDDTNSIEQNNSIQIEQLSLASLSKVMEQTRPVAMLSFALNYYLHGLSPFWFRITNLLIHLCTVMLLFFILRSTVSLLFQGEVMQQYRWLPTVAVLLWAVNPLHVQSVTYIVQRMNSLAALFYLLSLLMYIFARLSFHNLGRIIFTCCCVLAALLAMASKPNAAVLPFTLFLYEWFFFQKLSWTWLRKYLLFYLFALGLVLSIVYYFSNGHPLSMLDHWNTTRPFTCTQRLMTEFRVVILYLSWLIFPHPSRLNMDHDILLSTSLLAPPSTAICLLGIVGLLVLGTITASRLPLFAFGIFWFFLNLLIESTVIPLDFIFEYRTYIPSIMLIAGLVFLMMRFLQRKYIMLCTVIICSCWSAWTYQWNYVWRDGVSVWQDSAIKSPNKARPHESLAYYLEQAGRYTEALPHYLRAIQLQPGDANTHNNIANLYTKTGDMQTAISYYNIALKIRPGYKEAQDNLDSVLNFIKNNDQPASYYNRILEDDPKNAQAHGNLANLLATQGKMAKALQHYDQAIELEPQSIENLYNRSVLLLRTGKFTEAEQSLEKVVRLRETLAVGHNNLGVAQENLGKIEAATQSYQQALHINPHFNDARKNLDRLQR